MSTNETIYYHLVNLYIGPNKKVDSIDFTSCHAINCNTPLYNTLYAQKNIEDIQSQQTAYHKYKCIHYSNLNTCNFNICEENMKKLIEVQILIKNLDIETCYTRLKFLKEILEGNSWYKYFYQRQLKKEIVDIEDNIQLYLCYKSLETQLINSNNFQYLQQLYEEMKFHVNSNLTTNNLFIYLTKGTDLREFIKKDIIDSLTSKIQNS